MECFRILLKYFERWFLSKIRNRENALGFTSTLAEWFSRLNIAPSSGCSPLQSQFMTFTCHRLDCPGEHVRLVTCLLVALPRKAQLLLPRCHSSLNIDAISLWRLRTTQTNLSLIRCPRPRWRLSLQRRSLQRPHLLNTPRGLSKTAAQASIV